MKINQKFKSVFYVLCFTMVLMFSFKTSNAQYVRLEITVNSSYYGPSFTSGYVTQDYLLYDYYLRFYSDAACTIPTTSNNAVTGNFQYIMYYDEQLNYGGIADVTNSAPAGVYDIYLGAGYDHDLYIDSYGTAWGLRAAPLGLTLTGSGLTRRPDLYY